ncbi:hypothetical protein BMF94_0439 [Rhodotorula taiwanensis]|uniref:Uncharacterized protein n=1 Tax=Rhodotorula taiwanensis TaxID=741276 RepID=A0A2S5BHL4_9BASI|nr:hypothetical protein BMF94_0439 [Rhodotorula taiwanensis]
MVEEIQQDAPLARTRPDSETITLS